MFLKKKKLVLDIGANTVKAAVFLSTSKSAKLLDYSSVSIKQAGSVANAISVAKNKLSFKFKKANVAVGGREVFIQHITVEKFPEAQWGQQLVAEAEAYVPYEAEMANINYVYLGSSINTNKNEFLLIATPKQLIAQIQQDCLEAGLRCENVEPSSISLVNGFEYNYGILQNQNIAILEFGEERSTFVGMLNGRIYFVKNIEFGLSNYDQALSRQLSLSIAEAESLRKNFCLNKEVPEGTKEIVRSLHGNLRSELETAMEFIKGVLSKEPPTNLFLTGEGIALPNLLQEISEIVPCEIINIFLNTKYDEQKIEKSRLEEINSTGVTIAGLGSNH
ncbi:MAG: pilus assembly protein PilM [Bdellovibrionaceae bacterium]|nr:pilus assembly protein PilM [Pseudobdellovibrionaceae bacterium]